MGIHGRVRGGRATLVRVAGTDQRRARAQAVQEVPAARALGRANGTVPARVQAAQSQSETLPGVDSGGGRHGTVARPVLRGRGDDCLRPAAIHPAQGQVRGSRQNCRV